MLLNRGANISSVDNYGWSMFHFATNQLNSSMLFTDIFHHLLLISKNSSQPNDKDIVNYKDNDGRTPLMHAAVTNNITSVKLLLDAGAKISTLDNNGMSVYHMSSPEVQKVIEETNVNKVIEEHAKWSKKQEEEMKAYNKGKPKAKSKLNRDGGKNMNHRKGSPFLKEGEGNDAQDL